MRDQAAALTRTASADSEQAAQNAFCIGDTTVFRPDPGHLVREYLARDARGEFLSVSKFWLSATECTGEGTDYARVIASYSVDSLPIRADTARFPVTYVFLGDLEQSAPAFEPRVATVVDTFVVVRRRWGWRLVGDHDVPTLLPGPARALWGLKGADRARLDSAEHVALRKRGA